MATKRAPMCIWLTLVVSSVGADDEVSRFNAGGELLRPQDYRQWAFVSSGLGMTYGPARPEPGRPPHFTNVFVNPEAYDAFVEDGHWPDGTIFLLEVRRSEENVSIATGGWTQGERVALEASVKDRRRFPGSGWAYFDFGTRTAAAPLPTTESCYSCHSEHGAVDWTFSQFYPDLFEIARNLGTVRADYDPLRKVE